MLIDAIVAMAHQLDRVLAEGGDPGPARTVAALWLRPVPGLPLQPPTARGRVPRLGGGAAVNQVAKAASTAHPLFPIRQGNISV